MSISSQIQSQIQQLPETSTLWVAYSGGLDSHVLLHSLATMPLTQQLKAIHIHHGLQTVADNWVKHCQHVCDELGIALEVVHLHLNPSTGESIEALARTGRYRAFAAKLSAGDYLLTAQHADDQAETLLLQLLRGSSAAGLAAMPQQRALGKGFLLRPLLTCSQASLQAYAQAAQLQWIEDPSNQDLRFDRNYLRQQIMPLLSSRWQGAVKSLNRAAQHQAEHVQLLAELTEADYQHCLLAQGRLSLAALLSLSDTRQRYVLRYWIQQAGFPSPNQARLHNLQASFNQRTDTQLLLQWQAYEIRCYRGALYLQQQLPALPQQKNWLWQDLSQPLIIGAGELRIKANLSTWQTLAPLTVRLRQGGERLRYYRQEKTVKNLLQQADIAPWLRPYLPLLYQGDELIAIPDVALCDRLHKAMPAGLVSLSFQVQAR